MSAVTDTTLEDDVATAVDPVAAAHDYIASHAFRDTGTARTVGLELEFHLVDLARPAQRPPWTTVAALLGELSTLAMPGGSSITVEPGGQLELSTPPGPDVVAAVAALAADRAVLRDALTAASFAAAPLGADPARAPRRINPADRYVSMEAHFAAMGCPDAGREMMTATAALQLNLDAGPASAWAARVGHLHDLGPTLVALSACSPVLGGGRPTGWRSTRQHAWQCIDPRRTAPFTRGGADPGDDWAAYALAAPVLGVDGPAGLEPVTAAVPLADWLAGRGPVPRRPTRADVDRHLSTLFPPVRPRGYLELRYLDAQPDRWWPALAAIVATLADDPAAADAAAGIVAPVRGRWADAARHGLDDTALHRAAVGCVRLALEHCPPDLHGDVSAYAELVESGRTPGDLLAARLAVIGPTAALEEAARA